MGIKTPPCKKWPAWTEARYRQFIRSALRKAWQRWPPKFECLRKARRTGVGKRHKFEYKCASCKEWFKSTEIQVDHIEPVGALVSWDVFIDRLFPDVSNLQVLCKPCHKEKTREERLLNK